MSRRTDSARSSRATASGLLTTASATAALRSENAVGTATASTASTPSSAATSSRQARKASVVTTGLVSTGPVTTARGRQQPAQRALGGRAELHDLQAVVGAGVGGQRARAAGVGDDRDPVARGQRLAGQQRRGIDQLAETRGGDDTRLVEHGLLGGQRRRGRRGVRGRRGGPPGTGRR